MKILIVDDNYTDIVLAKEAFEELGLKPEILEAENGEECLEILEQNEHNLPDLVLLDIKMPRMDGLEALKIIKSKYGDKVPVIMLTTSVEEAHILEAEMADADAYCEKPIDLDVLSFRLRAIKDVFIDKLFDFIKFSKRAIV